ncbi:hypothetical protein OMP43_16390 [Sphingomonas sp. CBMAI 2297]|uniref:hypothetical protein n=1 Tax=Sphingomonas sp. CBMAI 2297 TaxID=2991720 RepID=UPI002458261E|nr:hypothetical protein [Sphingomonas sp. CBMAI 2297]MDH4745604.1 hypothetical protein [Sphingomonas sp. CBMAI 2297]
MNDRPSAQPASGVTEALEAVYRIFAMRPPSTITGCPCCIDTRGTDVLLTTPLREISGRALWRCVSGAFLTVGGKQDFRYLLPRILEVSVSDPGNANDPEIVLGKLALGKWRTWAADEQLVIEACIDAWFGQALARDLAEANEGFVGWDALSVLCGAGRAGLPLQRWLSRLAEPDAAPVLPGMREQLPTKPSGFWEDAQDAFHEVRTFLDRDWA